MNRLYRCYGCTDQNQMPGKDFTCVADTVVCPCGVTMAEAPEMVVALSIIHFDPPHDNIKLADRRGRGTLACQPNVKVGTNNCVVSGDPRAVNCPACRGTPEHKSAVVKWGSNPLFDIPLVIRADGVHAPSDEEVESIVKAGLSGEKGGGK